MMRSSASAAVLGSLISGVSAAKCACKFQNQDLPEDLIEEYPLDDPGKHKDDTVDGLYGTMCAAWDQLPGSPWHDDYCDTPEKRAANNWCVAPWCYVEESCEEKEPTDVFNGSTTAFFSYQACGAPDCYSNPNATGCPYAGVYDATCPCVYATGTLSDDEIEGYPLDEPGKYKDFKAIEYYGVTCAAWDQKKDHNPHLEYCPVGSDWCSSAHNFCQAPWCYVLETCSVAKSLSSIFNGSVAGTNALYYSYETCGAPDCHTNFENDDCPWDGIEDGWYTAADCSETETGDDDDDSKAASACALSGFITASLLWSW